MTLEQRVTGANAARALFELMSDDIPADTVDADYRAGFWTAIRAMIPDRHMPTVMRQPEVPKMDDAAARAFEAKQTGFGQHAQLTYGECPIDYLVWLSDRQQELMAYLRSTRGQARQSDE